MKKILEVYYPIIIAFICMIYSISLGLSGNIARLNIQLIGLEQFYYLQLLFVREKILITKKNNMLSPLMFIVGFVIFLLYMSGLLYMIKKSHDDQKRKE